MELDALYTLPPSSLLRGTVLNLYTTESQFSRFNALLANDRIELKDAALGEFSIKFCRDYFIRQRNSLLGQLDNNEITEKPPSFKDILDSFGLMLRPSGSSSFFDVLGEFARASARKSWEARLQLEAFEATERQWFIVFDTITYDPGQFSDEVMYGEYWAQYRTSVQNSVVRRIFGSVSRFKKLGFQYSDYVRYFAVPELHKDGRTHLHILWFLRELPDVSSEACPNMFRDVPNRRQIDGWPEFKYGRIAMRIAVRYTGDAFTKRLGWRWPVGSTGERIPFKDVFAIARYVAKYLDKPRPEALKSCRVRTSQSLGLTRLQNYLQKLSIPQLTMLVRNPRFHVKPRAIVGVRIPKPLLKIQALREICIKFQNLNLPMNKQLELLRNVMGKISPPKLQERFSLIERIQTLSRLANFIDFVMSTLTSGDISELENIFQEFDKPQFFMCAPCHKPNGVLHHA